MKIAFCPLVIAALACGCIRAPDIVLVDRATALEQEAAGSFAPLEAELVAAGMAPRPTPFSKEQLEAVGLEPRPLSDEAELADADRIDALLKKRCAGEALDGTLADTHDACGADEDVPALLALLDRANRDRAQIWRYLEARRPKAKPADVRRAWREVHLRAVVCGGQVQRADGSWEAKKC